MEIKFISFYLPQFYPNKENDEWWQKGFTEWYNVGRAKPLFKNHYQPKVPTELGYYDLRVPEVRKQQAELARYAGIEGFCYWHYWFEGKRLLDRVFDEVVKSGQPDFPFCLCWANHSWYKKSWDPSQPNILLQEQTYGGEKDFVNHFNAMLDAFKDTRYIRIDGKLLFGIYRPLDFKEFISFKRIWNKLASEHGLGEFMFFGFTFEESEINPILEHGVDTVVFDYMLSSYRNLNFGLIKKIRRKIRQYLGFANTFEYKDYTKEVVKEFINHKNVYSCLIPNYDHSPRSGNKNVILHNSHPKYFGQLCSEIKKKVIDSDNQNKVIFIKAWNEWAEGNYLEPDIKYGRGYLDELRKVTHKKD